MLTENSLVRFGFNPHTEAIRLNKLPQPDRFNYLAREHESYVNHLVEDEAVSILYHYYFDQNGEIFSSPSRTPGTNVKYQIDTHERNGLFFEGILKASQMARDYPGQMIALYSPTGKKIFDETSLDSVEPSMREFLLKPYTDGQLYFLYFDKGAIHNIAVSIHDDKNPWLSELSFDFDQIRNTADETERITSYLTHPVPVGTLDSFFQKSWKSNHLIYRNIHQKQFFLEDVITEMRQTFAGKKRLFINVFDATVSSLTQNEITAKMIQNGYRLILHNAMRQRGVSSLLLGGGCGGGLVTEKGLIQRNPAEIVSSFSSNFRYLKQDMTGMLKLESGGDESDEYGPLKFQCPHRDCMKINRRPPHKLIPNCQHCGKDVKC